MPILRGAGLAVVLAAVLAGSGTAAAEEAAPPPLSATSAASSALAAPTPTPHATPRPVRYAPLPQDAMPAELRASIVASASMLERFLSDKSLKYRQLESALREAITAADALALQQPEQALQRLQAVSQWRAPDEIPHVAFLSRLSYLQGQLGNAAEQQRLRLMLFGLQQAIGMKGDALSFETAIEVPFIAMEYDWLADRRLRTERQSLVQQGGKSFDVLTVLDENGQQGTRYFDVTRLFALRVASLGVKP